MARWATPEELRRYKRFKYVVLLSDPPESIAAGSSLHRINHRTFRAEEDMILTRIAIWVGHTADTPMEYHTIVHLFPMGSWDDRWSDAIKAIARVFLHYYGATATNDVYIIDLNPPLYLEEDDTVIVSHGVYNGTGGSVTTGDFVVELYLCEKE